MRANRIRAAAVLVSCAGVAAANLWAMTLGQGIKDWYAESDAVVPFRTGVNLATTANPWKQQYIEDLTPFSAIRYMDWQCIAGRATDGNWAARTKKTDPVTKQAAVWACKSGTAIEWMVDLCNRTSNDMWVCMPPSIVSATSINKLPDYALRFAILVKTGVDMGSVDLAPLMDNLSKMGAQDLVAAGGTLTGTPLAEHLAVYTEYANETWLYFWDYVDGAGKTLGMSGGGADFTGVAHLRVGEAFLKVFGYDSKRVRIMLVGQAGNAYHCERHIKMMNDSKWNPRGVKAYGVAGAPYMTGSSPAEMRASIPTKVKEMQNHADLVKGTDMKVCCYEGGQHHANSGCEQSNTDPAIYGVYLDYLKAMSAVVSGVFMHYDYLSLWGWYGCWGSKKDLTQTPEQAPKFKALLEWAKANNPPEGVSVKHAASGRMEPLRAPHAAASISGVGIYRASASNPGRNVLFDMRGRARSAAARVLPLAGSLDIR